MKITKKELRKIIREEAIKFKKTLKLKSQLTEIQKQIDEVYAGDNLDAKKQRGVHAGQKKAVFKKKGGALVEDEVAEEEVVAEKEVNKEDVVAEEVAAEEEVNEVETVAENLDEPIEGESVAQKVNHAKVDDGHEKDTHVKEGEEKKESIISEEFKRMKELAGYPKSIT